jgi:glyoxylase-like metal-dependent hydrolase (beta-lactamase superfamily II)
VRKENVYRFVIGQRRSAVHPEPTMMIKHPASDISVPHDFWKHVRIHSDIQSRCMNSNTYPAASELHVERIPQGISGTTGYILASQGEGVIIDPGSRFKKIWAAVERAGVRIKYIIITQGHSDHMIALEELKEATGAQVAMHEFDKWVVSKQIYRDSFLMQYRQPYGHVDIGLQDGNKLNFGGQTLEIIHTADQTQGCICVKCNEMLFSGKLMMQPIEQPFEPEVELGSSKMEAYRKVISQMSNNFVVYPGYGKPLFVEFTGRN